MLVSTEIRIVSQLPADDEARLRHLVNAVATVALKTGRSILSHVEVVPGYALETRVNEILASNSATAGQTYQLPSHDPGGVAIPIMGAGEFTAVVVLTEERVKDTGKIAELISLLAEELLHVEMYSKRFAQVSYQPPQGPSYWLTLRDIASTRLIDEFMVNQAKVKLLATYAFIEVDGEPQPLLVVSKVSLALAMDQAHQRLTEVVREVASGGLPFPANWEAMLRWMSRMVFEPLAYGFGKRIDTGGDQDTLAQVSASPFFRDNVRQFWQPILQYMQNIDWSTLSGYEESEIGIAKVLLLFLSHIGVDVDSTGYVSFPMRLARWA